MDEAEQTLEPGPRQSSTRGRGALWTRLRGLVRRLARRDRAADAHAQKKSGAIDDELERLYDLQWQISDSARRYRDLLDAQAGLIVRRDSQGRVIFANRAYLAAFGFSEEEMAGRVHEPHVLATEQSHGRRLTECIETVAGPRWIEWEETCCGLSAAGEAETQRTGRDVTEEREAGLQLTRARDAALEGSRAKSRFLATMSHEIRTPMNGILGMTDLLLDGPLTTDQALYAKSIEQSARALLGLIDEILDFSRIEAGKLTLADTPFSVESTVAASVALLQPKAVSKGLDLSWSVEGKIPPMLIGDDLRLRQIVLNLVSNAVKFTDRGGVRVTVSARQSTAGSRAVAVRIAVEDTGIGLSAAECQTIFAEFEQAEAAVRRQDGGSGLGLAIARRIARAMQGDITVTSEPGRGSTFIAEVLLERPDENAAALRSALESAERAVARSGSDGHLKPGRPRVLVAEDNAINALLATRLLERHGCEVTRVTSGDEAVSAVARTLGGQEPGFDLVLMDIYMPRLDGVDATRAIRRLLAASNVERLPIVAVTANAFAEDRQRYLAAGLDDFLAKPFDSDALAAILTRWLNAGKRRNPAA